MLRAPRDAERILRLPFIHHPQLSQRTQQLAADPSMTFRGAIDVLCNEMSRLDINQLDIEMCHPNVKASVAFVPVSGNPANEMQQSISDHVARILEAQK